MKKSMLDSAKVAVLEFRMAIFYFVLFSFNTLCSAIIIALEGKDWSTLTGQAKFIIVVAVLMNWTGTILAFISKASQRLKQNTSTGNSTDTQLFFNSLANTTNTPKLSS